VEVRGRPKPTIQLSKQLAVRADGTFVLCPGDQVVLRASDGFATYQWNTGETTQSITVRQDGKYWVTVRDSSTGEGCSGTSQPVEIAIGDTVKPQVLSDRGMRFCDGDRIVLRTDRSYRQYRWSTGEQSPTIIVTAAGDYWVEATDEFGCSGVSDIVRVDVDPNPIEIVSTAGSFWRFDTTTATAVRCDSLRVRNTSSQTLVIGSARLERNIEFSIPLAQLPLLIPPGQERWILACFQPTAVGEQRDTLRISDASDYCWRELTVAGVCAANSYTAASSCNVGVQAQTQTFDIAGLLVVPPYPNPAQDEVRALARTQDLTVRLRGAFGSECVQCAQVASRAQWWEFRCRLEQLPSGFYILELVSGQQRWCYPVVVAR
ncbi:MAG: hypothetical protein D6747_08120, partial [Chlorobiota bacterium]